jgi:hypothetical protein
MDLEPERLVAALRKMRVGHVAIPQDRVKTRRPTNDAAATGPHLKAIVPDWLIRALDHGQDEPRVRLAVFSVANEHELWATLAMRRADVELRFVMPLDDVGVQAFFQHGLRGADLCIALEAEDAEHSADVIVGINLGNGLELGSLLRRARRFDGSLTRLAQVVQLMSCATSMPLVDVDSSGGEVVVILASNRAHTLVAGGGLPGKASPEG